jgi:hypothetical protein
MNGLTPGWKIFRAICILQLILVAFELMFSIAQIFYGKNLLIRLVETGAYAVILIFLYMGFNLLNDNYPDTPLSVRQKRNFNLLYLLNFLFIAVLFGELVSEWRTTIPFLTMVKTNMSGYIMISLFLLLSILIFIFHLIFLAGMYQLRRTIYFNSRRMFENEFDLDRD